MNHSVQKITLYIGIVSISLILAYFLFSKSDSNKNSQGRGELSSNKIYNSGREALQADKQDASLFDSENGFLEFSKSEEIEENSTNKDSSYDPAKISPEERERRQKLAIERFKPLLKIFPNNRYIPREKTDKEIAKEQRKNEVMFSLQERILTGDELTADEALFFYSEKKQELAEKLEILNYAKEKLVSNPSANSVTNDMLTKRFESIQSRSNVYENEIKSAQDSGGDLKNYNWE